MEKQKTFGNEKENSEVEVENDLVADDFEIQMKVENKSDYEEGGEEDITLDEKAMTMKMRLVQDRSTWPVSETDGEAINNEPTQTARLRAHVCEYCNYMAPKKYLMMRHMNRSHSDERPNTCYYCGRCFRTLASLLTHIEAHSDGRPPACSFCGKNFATRCEVVRRVCYKHQRVRPHKWPDCDKMHGELSKLTRHMEYHNDSPHERPHKWPDCDKMPGEPSKLRIHMEYHVDSPHERPHIWPDCDKMPEKPSNLTRHMKSHVSNLVAIVKIVPAEDLVEVGNESKGGDASEEYDDNDVQSNVVPAEDQVEEEKESKGGDVDDGDKSEVEVNEDRSNDNEEIGDEKVKQNLPMMHHFDGECKTTGPEHYRIYWSRSLQMNFNFRDFDRIFPALHVLKLFQRRSCFRHTLQAPMMGINI